MQAADLIRYINTPSLLDKDSVKQLQKLVSDFPYFQSAHLLLSMSAKKWDTSVYQQSLKKTAIVASDRAHLFRLIHQVENEVQEAAHPVLQQEPVKEAAKIDTLQEDTRQELDILKAAEIAAEPVEISVTKEAEKEIPAEEKEEQKPVLNAEQILEREIGKEVVNSFVEKEILKTPELHRPAEKESEEAPESFAGWLAFLKKNNGQSYEQIAAEVNKEKAKRETPPEPEIKKEEIPSGQKQVEARKLRNKAIIDKIIENSPGIIRQKEDQRFYAPDIKAKESLLENEHLVTETLAKIYALQGSINKAIRAYEILSLKFPQKRAYFDAQIQKLKHNA